MLALKMPVGEAVITAVLGYAVVFFGLILLMAVVSLIGKSLASEKKEQQPEPVAAPAAEAPEAEDTTPAPGVAGELKLHNVDPKIAAMLMAIVADKLQKPINELRFISIKEVE